ncbi:hypothetical protein SprV_0602173000 [Sparganum proliferum]
MSLREAVFVQLEKREALKINKREEETEVVKRSTQSSKGRISGWQDDSLINRIREQVSSSSQPFKSCACCSDASCRGYSWIDPCKMTLFSTDRLVDEKTD